MKTWKVWLHGLIAVLISGFATSISGAVALPTVFTLDRNGVANMIKMSIPPAILAVALYLKSSPLPPLTATLDKQGNLSSVSGSVEVAVTEEKKP